MGRASELFKKLAKLYGEMEIEYPHLKAVTLAQWALESAWGTSSLATEHLNFGGLKYRKEMAPYVQKVSYEAHDGVDFYCKFPNLEGFIKGYWAFIHRSPYSGWEEHTDSPEDFMEFIGPIYCPRSGYVNDVLELIDEAEKVLSAP
jgi:N-acetylmuramoyl-L-alanine amidase